MRLGPDGALPPKKKRTPAAPVSRPAPALRDSPSVVHRKRANPKRKLTERQQRLDAAYGDQYRNETGTELASNAGLMRALLEQGITNAAALKAVANDTTHRHDDRAPDPTMLAENTAPRLHFATPHPTDALSPAPARLLPRKGGGGGLRFDLGDALSTWAGIGSDLVHGVGTGDVKSGPDPEAQAYEASLTAEQRAAKDAADRTMRAQYEAWKAAHGGPEPSATPDVIAESLLGGGAGGLLAGGLRAAGLGLAARSAGADLLPTALPTAGKLGLRDAIHPIRAAGKVAAKSPLHSAAVGAAATAASPIAAQLAASTRNLKQPPIPFSAIDNFGIAEAAYAQGGQLDPQQKADIQRQLGKDGHLISSTQARDALLKAAKANGWQDNEHVDDLTLIEHSMLGAPSGPRLYAGRAFHDIAVLSDIPTAAQAIGGTVKQSVEQRSARPVLSMAQSSFIDPTLYAFEHPVESLKQRPILTPTLWNAGARIAGGALGARIPHGGVRTIKLPGQGVVELGPKPSNLVDRATQNIHDRALSAGNEAGNPLQRLLAKGAVNAQTKAGKRIITQAQHRADVEAAQLVHKAERSIRSMHPDVANAFNEVVQFSPHHDRPTTDSYLQDFDHFINGMKAELADTKRQLEATIKTGPRAGELKRGDHTEGRRELLQRAETQAAAIERYKNLKRVWAERKPKVDKIHEAAKHFGAVEAANIDTIAQHAESPGLRSNLETRAHADRLALDTNLKQAVRAEQQAARKAHTAAVKAHTKRTGESQAALEAAQRDLEAARAEHARIRQLRDLHTTTPEQVASSAVSAHAADMKLAEHGITPDSAGLQRSVQIYRKMFAQSRNRKAANQDKVMTANSRVGSDIVTKDGEHGIITGVTRGGGGGLKLTKAGGTTTARAGSAAHKGSSAIVYEATIVAKDGTHYRTELGGVEAVNAINAFDSIMGNAVQRGSKEKAGWAKTTHETVHIVGENRHHLSNEPLYDFPLEHETAVNYLTKPASEAGVGVAKVTNGKGFGQRIGGQGPGLASSFHVVAKQGDTVFTLPDAFFATVDEARAFARELDQRIAEKGTAAANESAAMLRERESTASADAGIPSFGQGAPEPAAPAPVAAPEAPAEVPARFTPERLKAARNAAKKARTEAKRLRALGERQAAAATPTTTKIPVSMIDAILVKTKGKPEFAALEAALRDGKGSGKLNRSVSVKPSEIPQLRAQLRALKTKQAEALAAKLPHSAGLARSAKAAGGNLERAATVERRAAAIERRAGELEAAITAQEKAASGAMAEGKRTAAELAAAEKVAKAQERLAKAEEQAGIVRGEKAPERPDLVAIEQRHRQNAVAALVERGATPAFRPHVRGEEGAHPTVPVGRDRTFRESFADNLGQSRLKHNTLANIRAGNVKADVHLTIRAMKAPAQAKELADGSRVLADRYGTRIELRPGAKLTSPVGRTDSRRTIGDLYTKIDEGAGTTEDAAKLFDGMFEVVGDTAGKFDHKIAPDQVVVKTAADTYYVMPKTAVDELRGWFADTMSTYNRPGMMQKFTKAWRTQALNSTPTTPINNFLGNVILALTGGAGPISLARAVRATVGKGKWADIIPSIERGSGNAGTTTGALGPEKGLFGGKHFGGGRGPVSRSGRRYVNGIRQANVLAEDYGRLALWIKQATKDAKREQFGPVMSKLRRANDETMQMIADGNIDGEKIHNYVNDFFGDLYKRGAHDRALFMAIPFHRWFRHMVRLSLLTMPTKYPKRAAFLMELGQLGEDYRKEHGVYPEWMRGVILLGTELVGPIPGAENLVQHTLGTTGFNPFSSTTQFLGGGVGGGVNPITVSILSLLGEKHVEDFGDLSSSIYGGESAQIRDLKDWQGNPITRGSEDWFRAGAHEIAAWLPLVNKAFPSSGRDDAYIPGIDDKLPFIGRIGSDHRRTYAPPQGGAPLPPWLSPAQTSRNATSFIERAFAMRDQPLVVGGPAFDITATKSIGRTRQQAAKQGKPDIQRTPDPVAP